MIPNYRFSKAQLEVMNVKDLRILSDYYKVGYDMQTPKGSLIRGILFGQINSVPYDDNNHVEEPKMSVRISRIKASLEGD